MRNLIRRLKGQKPVYRVKAGTHIRYERPYALPIELFINYKGKEMWHSNRGYVWFKAL